MNRKLKHTKWKIATAICLIFSIVSICFNCYLTHRYNRLADSFESNILALATMRQDEFEKIELQIETLNLINNNTQQSIINITETIQDNNRLFLELINEIEKKLGPRRSILL